MAAGPIRVDWPTFWGAVFFLLIGGGFAGFGGYQLITTYVFMTGASERLAVVLSNPENCDSDGDCTWRPTLSVSEADGSLYEARTRFGASNFGWSEGTELTVLRNPGYPYVRMPGADNLYLLGGGFFLIGMIPVVIALWLLRRMVFSRAAPLRPDNG